MYYLCIRKKKQQAISNNLKIKEYETNYIILIDGSHDRSYFRSQARRECNSSSRHYFLCRKYENVASADQASYYRLLMTTGAGINKKDVFQDFYMNGNLRAEGGYSFIDLGNDRNTIFNGEVTTYYKNGKEKWHGKYVNGKREGYFTLQLREGGVAVVQFKNGKSIHNYFMITYKDGTTEKKNLSEIQSLM